MPFPPVKASAERHLFFAVLGWIVFLLSVALILPPCDSRVPPQPLTYWSIIEIAAGLAIYTAIMVPSYFCQSWRRLPTVPNKISYGIWISFESLVFLAILVWLSFVLIDMRAGTHLF